MMETRSHDHAKVQETAERTNVSGNNTKDLNFADIMKDAGPIALHQPERRPWSDFEDGYYDRYADKPNRSSWLEFEDPYKDRRSAGKPYDHASSDHG